MSDMALPEQNLAAALSYAQSHGASQSVIDELTKQLHDAEAQVQVDFTNDWAQVAASNGDMTKATQLWGEALEQQAAAQAADTTSTEANTKAVKDLTAALTNTPTGFKVGAYESQFGGGALGSAMSGGANVVVLNVNATSPGGLLAAIQQAQSKGNGSGLGKYRR